LLRRFETFLNAQEVTTLNSKHINDIYLYYFDFSLQKKNQSPPEAITDLRLVGSGSIPPDILIANLKWIAPALSPETPSTKGMWNSTHLFTLDLC